MTAVLKEGFDGANEFRSLALRYAEIGAQNGVRITPYLSPEMPLYHAATDDQKRTVIRTLQHIVSIHEEVIAANARPINTKTLIWRALGKLGMTPGRGLMDQLTDDEVVVIYNSDQQAAFWNLQFFNVISFTVEQVFFTPWHECTRRDPIYTKKLIAIVQDVLSGKLNGTWDPQIPVHLVEELNSPGKLTTNMHLKLFSTLTRNGSFAGLLVVQGMEVVGHAGA